MRARMRKQSVIDEAAMNAAERHFCKAEALLHGAVFALQNDANGGGWGLDISADIAIQLLEEAKQERHSGVQQHTKARRSCGALPKKRQG